MALTLMEAQQRAAVVRPTRYEITLDLTEGDHTFRSTTTLRFDAQEGAVTWADLAASELLEARLNGDSLPAQAWSRRRLTLTGLREHNELTVVSRMAYAHDGQGLHRAVDPADGEHYVYGHLFLDAAPRVFACFDQPDLKCSYDVTVNVPKGWSVIANGACRETSPGIWRAATTKPLATYFVTVCAGPWASVRAEHDGIPLGLHARRSLRPYLEQQAEDLLEVTRRSFDHYHAQFGIRYPFGEYHQVFVPEFNAGAMENPGCVTFRDQLIFTGAASRSELLTRANTVSHEMAHMWFGDLVTMRWWDDLWLNESFAEYMANSTLVAATGYTDAWVAVSAGRKAWGYAAERSPSTHPVAGAPAQDTDAALQNFDGISYAKGSAALRQLVETVGDEAFLRGLRAYLERHSFGNASLGDFLAAVSEASGTDLTAWSNAWLRTAGMDTLRVEAEGDQVNLVVAPDASEPVVRMHSLHVDTYASDGRLVAQDVLRGVRGRTRLPQAQEARSSGAGVIVVPNAGDLTWAGVAFDDDDAAVLAQALPGIEDPTTRGMIWTALDHGLARATLSPEDVLGVFARAIEHETQAPVLDVATTIVLGRVIGRFLPWDERDEALRRVAEVGERVLGAGLKAADARMLAGIRLLADAADAERLRPWFAGRDLPEGLERDTPLRWRIARRLSALEAINIADLDAALDEDDTMSGRLGYLTARATRPDAGTKEWAWEELTAPPTAESPAHSNYEMNALAAGLWTARDASVLAPYIARYVTDIPRMREWVGEDALARVAVIAFPAALTGETLEVEARRMLDMDLPMSVHRAVTDQHALVLEVLRSRLVFGARD